MSRFITQTELRKDIAAIFRDVQAGQTLVITRNGVAVAELRALSPRRFVPRTAIADAAQRAPRVDGKLLRADLDSIADQAIDG